MNVSIVVPTYNRGHIIKRAIESILSQTCGDLELIIVDDGSTDNTANIVRQYTDTRIRYIKTDHAGGAAARNVGIENAKGTFIAFQDSDDEWFPQKLEKQLRVFESVPEATGVVYTGFWKIMKNGKKVYFPPETIKKKEGNIYDELLWGNFITNQAAMVRKTCFDQIGGYDESLPGMHEWDLWLRVAKKYDFAYIPEPLVLTHFTEDSITAKHDLRLKGREIIFHTHQEEFKKYPEIFAFHAYTIGHTKALRGEMPQGKSYLAIAWKAQPLNIQYGISLLASLFHSKKLYRAIASHGKSIVQ